MGRDKEAPRGLTRRDIVAAGLAGSGAVLLGGPGAAVARGTGTPEHIRLTRWRRAHSGWWTSGPVRIPRGADTLGLRSLHGSARIRSTAPGGGPGAWTPLGHGHSERATDPVWVGDATTVELEVRHPRDLQLLLVDSGGPAPTTGGRGTAHAAKATPHLPHLYAGQPSIIARNAWATSACKPRAFPPGYGEVDVAIVHHTETTNVYSAAQSAAIVRGICLYHIRANGWNDIGYDFLIDRYGQVFEGRAGGFDEPVVGAHAGGFNASSTGVALIGSFVYGRPSPAALRALNRLLAFKMSLHGIPASGTTRVTSGGTVFSRYRAGRRVTLQRISGHRDVDTTACPGSALYRLLPSIRRGVARSARYVNALDLSPGATPWVAGQGGTVAGHLTTLRGAARPGRTVSVQQRVGATETTLATVTTGADGSWTAGLTLSSNATLRAVFSAHGSTRAVISRSVFLPVACAVSLSAPPAGLTGQPIPLSGSTNPPKASVTIVVTQLQPDGTAAEVTRFAVTSAGDGTYQASWTPTGPGTYRLTAITAADRTNAAGASAPVDVTVT
jgi:hypothetical protein